MTVIRYFNQLIECESIVQILKRDIKLTEICRQVLCQEIILQTAQKYNLSVSDDEVQAEADQFRYQHKLESASDTFKWLQDNLITEVEWDDSIRIKLLMKKLSEYLFERKVEKYFRQNKLDFDQVVLYRMILAEESLAQEICYQIEERETSFYLAAHLHDIDEKRQLRCGYEGKLFRWNVLPHIAPKILGATPGEVIGPIFSPQGYELIMVENLLPAELTHETRQIILNRLFREWLDSELNYLLHSEEAIAY